MEEEPSALPPSSDDRSGALLRPRRKEARTSSDRGTAVTLLDRAESSFSVSIDAGSDHNVVEVHKERVAIAEEGFECDQEDNIEEAVAVVAPLQLQIPPKEHYQQLLIQAEQLYSDDRLLAAHRILSPIAESNPMLLTAHHQRMMHEAELCRDLVSKLPTYPSDTVGHNGEGNNNNNGGWHEHNETHGSRRLIIRHKFEEGASGTTLNARIDCAIEPTLLLPLLSVLNETDLYHTWLPDWDVPRLKVRRSVNLSQTGRCSQVLMLTMDVPWPLGPREAVLRAVACDDIDVDGTIVIRLDSLDTGDLDGLVKEPEDKGTVRVDFAGGFVFRKCPPDHPASLRKRKRKNKNKKKMLHLTNAVKDHLSNFNHHHHHHRNHNTTDSPEKKGIARTSTGTSKPHPRHEDDVSEDLILVSFAMHSDPRATSLPQSLTSFVVRTAIGTMWSKFLKVAEDIRDGKRPMHKSAIESKREMLYDWVENRVGCMLSLFGQAVHAIGGSLRKVAVEDLSTEHEGMRVCEE